jgi:hypothetical protein
LLFFSLAEAGFEFLESEFTPDLIWDRADFLSPLYFYFVLSNLRVIFYFFGTYFIVTGKSYFLNVDGFAWFLLVFTVGSITLLDFLRLDLGLADSFVWLLLIFLIYFLMVSLCTSTLLDLMMVDLLLFPSPPLALNIFNFRFEIFTKVSSSLPYSSEGISSLFLPLVAFLCLYADIDLFWGKCFFSSTRVLVRFFKGIG